MNIDPHLIRGLSYFKREAKPATYTSIVPSDNPYDPITGTPDTTDTDYPVTALLQKHDAVVLGEVIHADDLLCVIFGKIIFEPKPDDILVMDSETYRIQKIYRNVSKQVIIANVRQ